MIELEVISGVARGQRIKTSAPFVSVGRSPEHTLIIADPFVSRHHGEILLLDSGYQYRDLNSTHGTVLRRGSKESFVKQVVLQRGDELNVGASGNLLRVVDISTDEDQEKDRGITMLHISDDSFASPEKMFAHDSIALRTLVEFDTQILKSELTTERLLFQELVTYVSRVFNGLSYCAILDCTEEGPKAYEEQLGTASAEVRLSTSIISMAEEADRGIACEIRAGHAETIDGKSARLSDASQFRTRVAPTSSTCICIPIRGQGKATKFLQMERPSSAGLFERNDVGLVNSMVLRAASRIDNLQLVEQIQGLNLNASLGVFAGMIGHDIKNYLFYGKRLSDIRDDTLGMHPGIAKGIERSRKLAHGMKDLASPGRVSLTSVSLKTMVLEIAEEFTSLFGALCTFETDIEEDVPPVVTSEDLLSRAIWNLVMNAFHASESRPGKHSDPPLVRIRVWKHDPSSVSIKIVDNAGGIGPRTLKYIKESFELVERVYVQQENILDVVNKISRMEGFTNSLGLFFTSVAANDLSGSIEVTSEENLGSVFTLTIPVTITALNNLLRF